MFPELCSLRGQSSLLLEDPAVLHAMVVPLLLQPHILLPRQPEIHTERVHYPGPALAETHGTPALPYLAASWCL